MPKPTLPEWERVLEAAARLQQILPGAVLAGGTAAALHAQHRRSRDADHVLDDLPSRYDDVLAELEAVAGWKTARVQRPVQILERLDGIETGIRQMIRDEPLETIEIIEIIEHGNVLRIPSAAEILRIKAVLILKRNATRDYVDFAALARHLGITKSVEALRHLDEIYPQPNEESALQQLEMQLAAALPYDLEGVDLSEYRGLVAPWTDWNAVHAACAEIAIALFDGFAARVRD